MINDCIYSADYITTYSLKDSFLPTMPEDSFGETISAMSEGGSWYGEY